MKLKPFTLALVVTAVALSGVVYLTQVYAPPQSETADAAATPLFNFEEDEIQSFTLETRLRSLTFERDADGVWQMVEPDATVASDPSIAYLLNLVVTATSDRTLTVPTSDREDFGFHQPIATVEVTLNNQETHRLILGDYDVNRSFIYAQADPPTESAETMEVLLVSPDFDNAVNRPLSDWKQPAEAAEPSPDLEDTPPDEPESEPEAAEPESEPESEPEPEAEPEAEASSEALEASPSPDASNTPGTNTP